MSRRSCSFTLELKREAASLILDQDYCYIDAARSLGELNADRAWRDHAGK